MSDNVLDIAVGDKIIVTPIRGRRYGVKVSAVYGSMKCVSGQSFKVSDPSVLLPTNKLTSLHGATWKKV